MKFKSAWLEVENKKDYTVYVFFLMRLTMKSLYAGMRTADGCWCNFALYWGQSVQCTQYSVFQLQCRSKESAYMQYGIISCAYPHRYI